MPKLPSKLTFTECDSFDEVYKLLRRTFHAHNELANRVEALEAQAKQSRKAKKKERN